MTQPPPASRPHTTLLFINGSLRAGSSNEAALRTAQSCAPERTHAILYRRMAELPHFSPDLEQASLPEPVRDLRLELARADAVLFSTPEYAGALPGSFKNLLDWTVGEGLHQKPVGWLNVSPHERGAENAYAMLGVVLRYVNADVVEAACVRAPVRRDAVGPDGLVNDASARERIRDAVLALVNHVAKSRAEQR